MDNHVKFVQDALTVNNKRAEILGNGLSEKILNYKIKEAIYRHNKYKCADLALTFKSLPNLFAII